MKQDLGTPGLGRSSSIPRQRFVLPLMVALLGACRAAPPPLPPGGVIGTSPEKAPPPLVGHNLIYNDDFSEGTRSLPWTASFSGTGSGRSFVEKGELCLEVTNKGSNRWDAHLRQQHLLLQKGHKYSVQFKMHSSQPIRTYLKIGQAGQPYQEFWKMLFNVDHKT